MNCSNGGKHAWVKGDKRSHITLSVVGKEMCYCRIVLRLQKGRDVDQP
jgi:hypothetical protein